MLSNPGPDMPAREFYSPREIEALSGLSPSTVYRLIERGKLIAKKLGTKTLISAASFRALMASLPPAGAAARRGAGRRSRKGGNS